MSKIVITNINERIREVLAKYGMNREYNPLSMETCIFCDNSKIGTLDYVTSVESGMKNVNYPQPKGCELLVLPSIPSLA